MKLFEIQKNLNDSKARAGVLHTDRGSIETPVFMPVGTQGTVKAISQLQLKRLDFGIILGNSYHLYLRPGCELIREFGGLHNFINWDDAILTDSGGYQIFSLRDLRKISEEGAEFKSHIDGSKHFFSPESVVDIQRDLGSDFVMVFDECLPYPCERDKARKSMELSLRWADRCKNRFEQTASQYGKKQFLFGIGQGGMYDDLRTEYIEKMIDIGFDGYAIGGLSVGEPADVMYDLTEKSTSILPSDAPRYLMGVGTPENVLESIDRGVDMFDCVLPTRNARNGQLFTWNGKINIRNSKYKNDASPIDESIDCYASGNFSKAYLRHLFLCGEILGLALATEHNLAFYRTLTRTAREKILSGEFRQWKSKIVENMK